MQGTTRTTRTSVTQRMHARSLLSLAIVGGLLAVSASASAQNASPMGQLGNPDSWRSDEFNADWGLATINAQYAYARGLTGKGIRLGVYDSGTVFGHPEFAGKDHRAVHMADVLADGSVCTNTSIISGAGACFTSRGDQAQIRYVGFNDNVPENIRRIIQSGPYVQPGWEFNTHGTHVGGTIAANRDGSGMHGVAFGADLTAAKWSFNSVREWARTATGYSVVGIGGVGPEDATVAGMYAQMNEQGVRALNHSWGLATEPNTLAQLDGYLFDPDNAAYFDTFARGSLDKGMLQVWAAGNHNVAGTTPQTAPQAGLYASLPRGRAELEPYWLTVVNVNQNLVLSASSMRCAQTANWCVAAPGSVINSTVLGGEESLQGGLVRNPDGTISFDITAGAPTFEYGNLSGTSMATPHAVGSLGLLMERFPYLANTQVRDILLTTATDLGAPGVDEVYGWGLIDLRKAIDGPGQIRVDTDVVMDRPGGGAKLWDGKAWDDWRNDIGGPGVLSKSGLGWLRLSGNNSFGGLRVKDGVLELTGANTYAAQVEGGTLVVNGTLTTASLPVLAGGALGGSGRIVGDVRIEGAVSPGNSIGTLSVQGNYVQAAGSTYVAELSAGGASDRIDVSGQARLEGGKLVVLHAPGQYMLGQSFNVISAAGGVSGQFASLDQTAFSPFLKFGLSYAANQVGIDVTRGAALAASAQTDNQRAAAAAADRLAIGQGIPQPLTQLFPEQALAALDALSGEAHASLRSVMVDDQRHVRDAALSRARAGRGDFAADSAGESSQGAWVQLLKSGGTLDGDGNAARNEYSGSATLLGYDYRFDGGWRIGVLGGSGRSDSDDARNDKGRIKTRHLGLYAGQNWGGFGLSAGLSFARHDVDLDRGIAFNGFNDRARSNYDADSKQGFVEGAYRFDTGAWAFEPYAQFAQVRVNSDGFQESGGAAALTGRSADSRVNLSTLGLRFNVDLKGSQQEQSWLSLRGGLGRRHASGDLNPATSVAWRGGEAFQVHGAPLADDATLLEAGIAARLSANGLLELNYSGQLADEAHDHGVNARYSLRF